MISEEMVIARKNMSRRMRSRTKLTCEGRHSELKRDLHRLDGFFLPYLFPLEVELLPGVSLCVSEVGLVDRRGEFGQHSVEAWIVERFVH